MASCCEYGNDLSGSIKFGEFLDKLKTCLLFKDCTPLSWLLWNSELVENVAARLFK